jgi:hypothetical protein
MSIEAMKQALEALETPLHAQPLGLKQNAIVALRTAIDAELEQAMVEVWQTAPRQWVGLTNIEIENLSRLQVAENGAIYQPSFTAIVRAIESLLMERNR